MKQKDFLTQQQEEVCKRELLAAINTKGDICNFVTMFLHKQVPDEMLKEMAKFLHMLSGDACMSSVFPFEGNPYITRACAAISTNNLQPYIMEKIKEYNREVVRLLYLSQIHECVDVVTCFILCIISEIDEIHHLNRPVEQAQPIPGSYYPPGGIAYYFSPSGEQLRKMPDFTVNGTSSQPNYDDNPLVDPMCEKKFSGVSYGGYGYMFIWFCPIHGHTYGFHLINKAEGHRDPFCSLYKFLEDMPKHIFYDFACSLSEYALNRHQSFLDSLDSGMISSMPLATNVV